jgi:hypothetical protein
VIVSKTEPSLISFETVLLTLLLQFLLYFPAGFLLLHDKLRPHRFLICLPLYIVCGLFIDAIVLSILGIFYIGSLGLICITVLFYGIVLFRHRQALSRHALSVKIKQFASNDRITTVSTLVLFTLVIIGFSSLANFMEWPRSFDSMNHGLLTSLLVHNHKLQSTLAPLAPSQPWFEPFGFHLMSSTLSLLLDMIPGQSLFIFATLLQVLIILLTYSVVIVMTKAVSFSVLAAASVFYFYPALHGDYSLMGNYYLGIGPAVFGNLGLLLFLGFISILDPLKTGKSYLSISISIIGTGIAYPPFIIIPIILLIILGAVKYFRSRIKYIPVRFSQVLVPRKGNGINQEDESIYSNIVGWPSRNILKNKLNLVLLIAVIIIVSIIIFLLVNIQSWDLSNTNIDNNIVGRLSHFAYFYQITISEFTADIPTIVIILFTMILAVDSIIRRARINLSIFYLLFAGIEIISVREISSYNVFWVFLPSRLYPFLVLFAWIALAIYVNDRWTFINRMIERKVLPKFSKFKNKIIIEKIMLRTLTPILCTLLILAFFLFPIMNNFTFAIAKYWGYPYIELRNDFPLLTWMSQNINSSDLIMTDYSWESTYLNLFSLKNTTATYWPDSAEEMTRARFNQMAWDRPGEFIEDFIKKYNVKYIFVSSDPVFFNPNAIGGDNLYYLKNIKPDQYKDIFESLPFLEKVRETSGAVYRVVMQNELILLNK